MPSSETKTALTERSISTRNSAEYQRTWNAANRERAKTTRDAWRTAHPDQVKTYKRTWAERHPHLRRKQLRDDYQRRLTKALLHLGGCCLDCGNEDPDVLEFDHLPGFGPREHLVTELLTGPWHLVVAEMTKCNLVCANCHAKRTAARRRAGYVESERLAELEMMTSYRKGPDGSEYEIEVD